MLSAARRVLWPVLSHLPAPAEERLIAWSFGEGYTPPPAASPVPTTPVSLYIGPANSAGQGYRWARAVEERFAGVTARNLAVGDDAYGYEADVRIPTRVFATSRQWQQAEYQTVARYTHVMFEAERPLFARLDDGDAYAQARRLRSAGVKIAMMSHGSDLRSPDAHMARHEWSPFAEPGWDQVDVLRGLAARNSAGLRAMHAEGAAIFVPTPDLLLDAPYATWCPIVVDVGAWASDAPVLERATPVVVHAPSHGVIKGTAFVEKAMNELAAEGLIDYRSVSGVSHSTMRDLYQGADIVIDQLRIGTYATAACESMAAGRVVVGYVDDQVRGHAEQAAGGALPIVNANPDTIGDVVADLIANREQARAVAATGPGFVRTLHDGRASADALAPFLGVTSPGMAATDPKEPQ